MQNLVSRGVRVQNIRTAAASASGITTETLGRIAAAAVPAPLRADRKVLLGGEVSMGRPAREGLLR
jgi:hypothetical protein